MRQVQGLGPQERITDALLMTLSGFVTVTGLPGWRDGWPVALAQELQREHRDQYWRRRAVWS